MITAPCNTARRDEIDYEQSRKDFLKLAEHNLSNHKKYSLVYKVHTRKRIEQMISQKMEHPPLHAKYEVIRRDSNNILVVKKKSTNSYIQILSWEDIFDIFMPLHVRSGHRGKDNLKKEIITYSRKRNIEYRFPPMSLSYIKRVCNVCKQNNGKGPTLKAMKTGVVHVIAMAQTRPEEKFRYLLIYVDKETNYIILRPLTEKTSLEISLELFRIFTQFGPPMRLYVHGYNSTLTDKISNNLNELCPHFNITTKHEPPRYEVPALVTDRIQDWMSKSKSTIWEVGCFIVQAEMNNDPQMKPSTEHNQPHCTPHILYFHTQPDHTQDEALSTDDPYPDNFVIDLTEENLKNKHTQL